jgi:uncharacterized iron-regulated protein
MSDTTSAPAADPVDAKHTWTDTIFDVVHEAASNGYALLSSIDNEWDKVKANPQYGQIVTLIASTSAKVLAAHGVPVTGLTSLYDTAESLLHAFASVDPTMKQ